MGDALVTAGLLPAVVALLGRWEGFKAAAPAAVAAGGGSTLLWKLVVMELIGIVAGLAHSRGPAFHRQVCGRGKGGETLPLEGSSPQGGSTNIRREKMSAVVGPSACVTQAPVSFSY